jgi:Domain of unknown function (DU1801)
VAELKTKPTQESVRSYLSAIDDPARRADARTLCSMMQELSGEKPAMWGASMVGFGSYHYTYATGRQGDWPLVAFAARKDKLTVYLMDGFESRADLLDRLGKHSKGKSCLHIRRLDDVDVQVLRQLVKRSIAQMRQVPPA